MLGQEKYGKMKNLAIVAR